MTTATTAGANTSALATTLFYPSNNQRLRTLSLWYFGSLILLWTVLGHTIFGFEQSWAQACVAVGTACAMQFLLEAIDAWAVKRKPRYTMGFSATMTLVLPAVISGCAIGMLLFPNDRLMPLAFAAALAIASKVIFRVPVGKTTQHIFNPSNFGITATLLLFPWVGVAPPYHFTTNLVGIWNWVVPMAIIITGLVIHCLATGRLALVLSWLGGFALQAWIRHLIFGMPFITPLLPMTGTAFVLFTLYMIPDPATSPLKIKGQIAFGLSVAAVYGLLQVSHMVYGLFFSLTIVSSLRGLLLFYLSRKTAVKGVDITAQPD